MVSDVARQLIQCLRLLAKEVLGYSEWFLGYSGTIVARVFWVVLSVSGLF